MTTQTAACHCGQLKAICEGQPSRLAMCHCKFCQRRTGTAYSLGAWYKEDAVTISGEEKTYTRNGESDVGIIFRFCPNCGTNLYWTLGSRPGQIGIAAGCLNDTSLMKPTVSIYCESKIEWVQDPEGVPVFEKLSDV